MGSGECRTAGSGYRGSGFAGDTRTPIPETRTRKRKPAVAAPRMRAKRPFNYAVAFRRIDRALAEGEHAPAAMFQLFAEGYTSVFEQLVACIISIRTRDEVMLPTAKRLFARARTPAAYWIEIHRLLVPFGKHVCTGRLPRCSTCPVLDMCRQVGVTTHR